MTTLMIESWMVPVIVIAIAAVGAFFFARRQEACFSAMNSIGIISCIGGSMAFLLGWIIRGCF